MWAMLLLFLNVTLMPTALSFSCSAMVWELLTSGGSACHLRSVHPPVLRVVQLSTLAVNESTDSHRSSNILSGLRVSSSYRRPPSPCKVKALTCTGTDHFSCALMIPASLKLQQKLQQVQPQRLPLAAKQDSSFKTSFMVVFYQDFRTFKLHTCMENPVRWTDLTT